MSWSGGTALGEVVKFEKQTPLDAVLTQGEHGQRMITCPACKVATEVNPSYRGDVIKVTCVGCTKLLRAVPPAA